MNIRTLILDDNENSRLAALGALAEFPDVEVVGQFERSAELFHFLGERPAHLILLDIELDRESGFHIARRLRQEYPQLMIVFLTGHSSYAIDGYDFQPVNFLTKPINQKKLSQTLDEVRRRLTVNREQPPAQLMFRLLQGYRILDVRDIVYVEHMCKKNFLHTEKETLRIANYTMRELEEMLAECGFFYCHQSYIISLYRVEGIRETRRRIFDASLRGSAELIPVSRAKYENLVERLGELGIRIFTK